jgi:hypothetical protein
VDTTKKVFVSNLSFSTYRQSMLSMMSRKYDNVGPNNDPERAAQRIADLASNMRTGQSAAGMTDLGPAYRPGLGDVICARGKSATNHEGNRRFRTIIESRMEQYASTKNKFEKSVIVSQVVEEIRQGGGFVRPENGRWYEVGDQIAHEKVGQRYVKTLERGLVPLHDNNVEEKCMCLTMFFYSLLVPYLNHSFRDLLHSKYRSSTKAKKLRKQKMSNNDMNERKNTPNEKSSGTMSLLQSTTIHAGNPDRTASSTLEYQGAPLYLPSNPRQTYDHVNHPTLWEAATSTSGPTVASSQADQSANASGLEPLDAFTEGESPISGSIPPPDLELLMSILQDGESSSSTPDESKIATSSDKVDHSSFLG